MSRQVQTDALPTADPAPDFNHLLTVLRCEVPARPTLFEFAIHDALYKQLAGRPDEDWPDMLARYRTTSMAFRNAGYDYMILQVPGFGFTAGQVDQKRTRSINDGAVICDAASLHAYDWPDPDAVDYSLLNAVGHELPPGMKLLVHSPGGVLENAIKLMGFDAFCCTLIDDPPLVQAVLDRVGSCLLRYYEHCAASPAVGALVGNDDWGFKSQTMISPDQLRQFVFPWHKKIVAAAHAAGKPAVLHCCGYVEPIMDDIIDGMRYDGKHSFEDAIQPVEQAYEQYAGRIAILGGIDMDFMCRARPDQVYERAAAMLDRTQERGGYALGTGNSVPDYMPAPCFFALLRAAFDRRI